MILILTGIIILLLITLKVQRVFNLKEQINWITEIVSSDGYVSDNEKEKIVEFATRKNLSSERISQILQRAETIASQIRPQVEVINWNKRNGLEFEKTIIKMAVHKDQYSSYEVDFWSGDKCADGCYAKSNCDPDIIVRVRLKRIERQFAVECKWRKSFNNEDYVEIAKPYQLRHYRKCQKQWGFPVFIALGIGGEGCAPQNIYIIPLNAIRGCRVSKEWVQRFHKKDCFSKLYFDVNTLSLS